MGLGDCRLGKFTLVVVRDLEYDWQTLVENLADPSHVPFAHHGVQGNREQARPIALKIVQSTPNFIEVNTEGSFRTTITLHQDAG